MKIEWSPEQFAEKLRFVSGHRFSDAVRALNSNAPLGAGYRKLSFSANCEAAADFAGMVAYIHEQNPSAAGRVAHTMYDSAAALESFPNRGRPGRIDGTRELVLAPLPFIVVYRVRRDVVETARVLHGDNAGLRLRKWDARGDQPGRQSRLSPGLSPSKPARVW